MNHLDWNTTISTLRKVVPTAQFNNWLSPVRLVRADQSSVVIGVPSRFHGDWLKQHFREKIAEVIHEQVGSPVNLEFEVLLRDENVLSSQSTETNEGLLLRANNPEIQQPTFEVKTTTEQYVTSNNGQLPKFTSPIIQAEFNQLACQFADHFVTDAGSSMGSLYFWSGTGMGKSHLLSSIGTRLLESNPKLRVRYVTGESFTTEMVQSIKNNTNYTFKHKYRYETDVLLFDDIQVLSKRTRTQEEFLHCFNEILSRGGRVAFTSSVAPHRLEEFINPLKSRLLSSVGAEIKLPTEEDRIQLLAHASLLHQIETDDQTLKLISDRASQDIRELLGLLLRLHLQSKLLGRNLNADFLGEEGLAPLAQKTSITIEGIIDAVVATFGIKHEEVFSKSRKANLAWARQVCMYLARHFTMMPLEEIGKVFLRDHATVIHSYQKVSETIDNQPARRYEVEFVKNRLGIKK